MALKNWRFVVTGLGLLAACGGGPEEQDMTQLPDGSVPNGGGPDAGTAPGSADAASSSAASGADAAAGSSKSDAAQLTPSSDAALPTQTSDAGVGADTGPALAKPFDYMMQAVELTANLVIPKGKTVRVGPGVSFTAKSNIKIDVQGELQVEATAAAPATFVGNGTDSSWHGIVVEAGGKLTLSQAKISDAQYGVHAMPGSTFSIDRAVFDNSFKAAVLQSNGSITNSTFKAILLFPAVTDEVSIDDPNGALTIMDASPTITNCRFEGSGGLNDMIRIGGMASPIFDHISVTTSHCGFHISGGTNNAPKISNSIMENLSYGIMAYTGAPIVEGSVFRNNSTDVGICSGATSANTPKLSNNSYMGGVKLDASCDKIGTKDATPATTANPAAGPSGL